MSRAMATSVVPTLRARAVGLFVSGGSSSSSRSVLVHSYGAACTRTSLVPVLQPMSATRKTAETQLQHEHHLQSRSFSFVKVKAQKEKASTLIKLLPFLPGELVALTTSFLRREKNVKNLLQLIYSPAAPNDSEADREEYEKERRIYLSHLRKHEELLAKKKQLLEESTLKAIENLPKDFYEEAIESDNDPHPEGFRKSDVWPKDMLFHQMFRQQIFADMTFPEKKRLQTFQNFMRIRYPHAEVKRNDPERFWIPESQFVSRQRESVRNKNAKMSRSLSPVNQRI
ncbi:unnamed protein product [Amoebophrya sp. A120]|nr:unnamed protein product [Amoebophrya sp. A120]|eukprot:GSA120T00012902001.1